MKYNAIILGCGKIAGGYDRPGDKTILTHANAICSSEKIRLAGVYDIRKKASDEMASKWQTKAYSSIPEIFNATKPDIVVIAVPDEHHEDMLETLQPFSMGIVICEKPLGSDIVKLQNLLDEYKNRNIRIAVNYNRNYDQQIIQLRNEIQLGALGDLLNGVFFYSKGLRHNGSHAISLLRYLFGEVKSVRILDSRIDYKAADPTLDIQVQFSNGSRCYLLAGDEGRYSIFEWQFLFSNGRVTFNKDGFMMCRQDVTDDPMFPGYKTLGEPDCHETALKKSMSLLYENVVKHLEGQQDLLCPAEDALATQMVIEKILGQHNLNGVVEE